MGADTARFVAADASVVNNVHPFYECFRPYRFSCSYFGVVGRSSWLSLVSEEGFSMEDGLMWTECGQITDAVHLEVGTQGTGVVLIQTNGIY